MDAACTKNCSETDAAKAGSKGSRTNGSREGCCNGGHGRISAAGCSIYWRGDGGCNSCGATKYSNYFDSRGIYNVEECAKVVNKVGDGVAVAEEVIYIDGEVSSKLHSLGEFDGNNTVCSLSYHKRYGIVCVEVNIRTTFAHIYVLLQSRSCVVQVC